MGGGRGKDVCFGGGIGARGWGEDGVGGVERGQFDLIEAVDIEEVGSGGDDFVGGHP